MLTHTDSGLLTGKYKRGESPSSDSNSRLAWVEKDKATRANQASPSLSDYTDNEQYWELIEAMKTIATVHGECSSLRYKAKVLMLYHIPLRLRPVAS